jgi:cytochrome bd-type quinol oxidase subunit 1
MEQLPGYAYIHPIWQLVTLILGLFLAATALPNVDNPNFRVRGHERLGRIFVILVIAGAVFGKLVAASLPVGTLAIPGHRFLAAVIVGLVVIGSVFGYQGGRMRLRVRTGMMRAHPWFLVLAVALLLAQGLLGIGSRGLRLIKF